MNDRRDSVTLEDVARASGYSRATVSRVVNGDPRVDPVIAASVEKHVAKLGYVSNPSARALAGGSSRTIGLVFAETFLELFRNPFWGQLVEPVSNVLWQENYQVSFLVNDRARHDQVLTYLRQRHVDGVILMSLTTESDLTNALAREGFPCVVVGEPEAGVLVPAIDMDNVAVGRLAAERLLEAGAKHPVAIAGRTDMRVSDRRISGFTAGLRNAGIRLASTRVKAGDFTEDGGAAAMAELLATHPDLDAVFAANDRMAIGAMNVLQELGRKIPAEIKVVGVDGSGLGELPRPRLTSVGGDWTAFGHSMAQLMLGALRGDAPTTVLHHPTLIDRDSC